jgi:hypothetical protein
MGESVTLPPPAGWYRDPSDSHKFRYWDGSAWRPDVTAAINRMHLRSLEKVTFRRALARIGEFVADNETVERMATGMDHAWPYGNYGVLVVLTDRRMFFLKSGRKTKITRNFPLETVTFVECAWGGITLLARRERAQIAYMNSEDAKAIVDLMRRRINSQPTHDLRPWKRRWPWQRRQ